MSVRRTLDELRVSIEHQKGRRSARQYAGQSHLKLHIGCGGNVKEGWINIDLSDKADLHLDLREPLPFDDNSCSIIYSEHFFEHLEYPHQTAAFLKESRRVLEPGGVFSVSVPDTELPLREYGTKRAGGYFHHAKEIWHPPWCQTEMEHINFHFRQGREHKFAYDYETLAKVLAQAGFTNIRQREFCEGLDSKDRDLGSLFAEAVKPPDGTCASSA